MGQQNKLQLCWVRDVGETRAHFARQRVYKRSRVNQHPLLPPCSPHPHEAAAAVSISRVQHSPISQHQAHVVQGFVRVVRNTTAHATRIVGNDACFCRQVLESSNGVVMVIAAATAPVATTCVCATPGIEGQAFAVRNCQLFRLCCH